MLFWAASDRYNRYQQSDLTTAIKYKMVALRVLNERMSEVTQATMDDTIGTVTAAAGFEKLIECIWMVYSKLSVYEEVSRAFKFPIHS